jgi:hypothetical protein
MNVSRFLGRLIQERAAVPVPQQQQAVAHTQQRTGAATPPRRICQQRSSVSTGSFSKEQVDGARSCKAVRGRAHPVVVHVAQGCSCSTRARP